LGVCHRDVELAALWLKWAVFLSCVGGTDPYPLLVVYTKRAKAHGAEEMIRSALEPSKLHWSAVECPDEHEHGYPGSASHLFLRTLEAAEDIFPRHAVLWC